jgi:hypothetical protein
MDIKDAQYLRTTEILYKESRGCLPLTYAIVSIKVSYITSSTGILIPRNA